MKKTLIFVFLCLASWAMAVEPDTISCGAIRPKTVTTGLHWVEGFIVGWPVQNKGNEFTTTAPISGADSQLSLADDAQGTNCIPVQVSYAAQLDLGSVASNIGKKILIRGNVGSYFSVNGLTGTSAVVFLETIHAEGISVSPTEKTIKVAESFTITPTFSPVNADDKRISWSSSNPSVASVSNGVVTGVKNGTATITATTIDGNFKATTSVIVETGDGEIRMADVIVLDTTNATSDTYVDWSCIGASGTHYNGKSAKDQNTTAMQFNGSQDKASGIVNSESEGYIREIQIKWGANCQERTFNIYGGNTAFTLSDLQDEGKQSNKIGTISKGTTTFQVVGNYPYMGIRVSNSKAALIDTITFVWGINRHEDEDKPLTSISLSKDTITLEAEATDKLSVTYLPEDATNKGVSWKSTNTEVATVNNGTVTAVDEGEALIIATTTDGQDLKDSCLVVVTRKDIFKGRDIYYKITSIYDLHNNDSVILVNEEYNRASAAFETYTYKKKNDKNELIEYTAGRIAAAELEIVREGDSIGCWGVDEIRMERFEQGWQINVTTLEDDPYEEGVQIGIEKTLRATEMNKIMVSGEGNKYWNISFDTNGNAIITSKDNKAGRLQFNGSNKSFTTYTSDQAAVQIYRKKNQTIDPHPMGMEENSLHFDQSTKRIVNGLLLIERDGQLYTTMGVRFDNH